jgi:ribosomal protein S18 acetylase RimI-like enzyme
MLTTHTRIATMTDLAAIATLFDAYRQFYAQTPNLALATNFIRNRMRNGESVIIVANDDNQTIIGFCQLYPSFCSVAAQPIYVLYDLFVAPSVRGAGIGTQLLRHAELLAAEHGMTRMDLTTAKTNHSAQAVYEALDWVRDDVFYAYSKLV